VPPYHTCGTGTIMKESFLSSHALLFLFKHYPTCILPYGMSASWNATVLCKQKLAFQSWITTCSASMILLTSCSGLPFQRLNFTWNHTHQYQILVKVQKALTIILGVGTTESSFQTVMVEPFLHDLASIGCAWLWFLTKLPLVWPSTNQPHQAHLPLVLYH